MALAFYLCPPSPRKNWDDSDVEIQLLAREIRRTESAVCLKIANLKACDPNRTGLGFTNTAGMDRQIINEYLAEPDKTMSEAMWELEQIGIRISYDGEIEASNSSRPSRPQQLGLERFEQVRKRVNQDYFRGVLLANYGGACCLTGIDIPALLTASHIKPWSAATPSERLMSSNGPPAQCPARPRFRPWPHHTRRPPLRRGLLACAAHAHQRPMALCLRREKNRPTGQRQVNLAEPRLHPLPQRLRLRTVRVRTFFSENANCDSS